MPQLPSGRYIGIHCLGGAEIIRKYSDTHPEASLLTLGIEIAEMDSIEELPSYISILFLRESNSPTDISLDSRSQSIPTDAEPYASGFTLADQSIFTADWPEEDKRASLMAGNSSVTARNRIAAASTASIQISLVGMFMHLGKMSNRHCAAVE